MPYFSDPNQQDDEDQQGGFQVGGAAPQAGGAPQAGAQGAQGAKPKVEKTGSNFANIDKYITANQGQNFGGKVVGKVGEDVNKANQSMQDAASSFGQKVNANQVYGKEQVDAALADPSKADKAQFQGAIDQQYKGPKSLAESQDDFNKFSGSTSKAQASANALGTEAGRFGLLDQYFGRNNYGFGQKGLDNALFQATPGIGQQTQAVQSQANQLQSQGKQMQNQLQAQASQRAGEIEQAKNYTRQSLGLDNQGQVVSGQGAFGGLQKDLATGLQARNAERTAKQQALQQALAAGNEQGYDLSDAQLQELGIDPGSSTYGVDFSKYISPSQLNMDQFASDEQRSRLSALNDLVGQGYSQRMLGDKQEATSDLGFDKDRFLSDLESQKQSLQTSIDTPGQSTSAYGSSKIADQFNSMGFTANDRGQIVNKAGQIVDLTAPGSRWSRDAAAMNQYAAALAAQRAAANRKIY